MALGYDSTKIEVHIIAYIYHWGRKEILDLPVLVRKEYVDLIYKQKEAEAQASDTP